MVGVVAVAVSVAVDGGVTRIHMIGFDTSDFGNATSRIFRDLEASELATTPNQCICTSEPVVAMPMNDASISSVTPLTATALVLQSTREPRGEASQPAGFSTLIKLASLRTTAQGISALPSTCEIFQPICACATLKVISVTANILMTLIRINAPSLRL